MQLNDSKLRNKCGDDFCMMREFSPRWRVFTDCFTRGASISDLDGIIANGENVLFLEWKSPGQELNAGQSRLFADLSSKPLQWVLVIWGNAKTMKAEAVQVFMGGHAYERVNADSDDVHKWLREWWNWCEKGWKT